MLYFGEQKIERLYLGEMGIKRAAIGNEIIFTRTGGYCYLRLCAEKEK